MTRLQFDFSYCSTLKTREQILVSEFFVLATTAGYRRHWLLSSEPQEHVESRIAQELYSYAQETTNSWALRFLSADEALDPTSYQSLRNELLAIASYDFRVDKVAVRNIVPETPKLKAEPLLLPPEQKEPPVHPFVPIMKKLAENTLCYDELRKSLETARTTFPDLFNDETLGPKVRNLWESEALAVLFKNWRNR